MFRVFSCSVWSAIVATRICAESADCLGFAKGTERVSVLQAYVLLSLVLELDDHTPVHRVNQLTWTLQFRAPAEKVEYTSRTAAESVWGLDVNHSLSQQAKCILLTMHKARELAKLQAASYVGVR